MQKEFVFTRIDLALVQGQMSKTKTREKEGVKSKADLSIGTIIRRVESIMRYGKENSALSFFCLLFA